MGITKRDSISMCTQSVFRNGCECVCVSVCGIMWVYNGKPGHGESVLCERADYTHIL